MASVLLDRKTRRIDNATAVLIFLALFALGAWQYETIWKFLDPPPGLTLSDGRVLTPRVPPGGEVRVRWRVETPDPARVCSYTATREAINRVGLTVGRHQIVYGATTMPRSGDIDPSPPLAISFQNDWGPALYRSTVCFRCQGDLSRWFAVCRTYTLPFEIVPRE